MPYDPRMLQMARMGAGMMGPQQGNPFVQGTGNQPWKWWEQPLPSQRNQQQDDDTGQSAKPTGQSANSPNSATPSLLQMLMLGGKPSYSGKPGAAPSGSYGAIPGMGASGMNLSPMAGYGMTSPWAWLGSLGGGTPG